ncbi:DMT family transporter [Salsuginibacillus kocurii]|uniref:DMT family transporter n=1 Tax=Salsuginibacillus kocurii TaxID=427078 RepID=UPI000362CC17|nr:DMT family transporter [Salsuginibacillus kocurii]
MTTKNELWFFYTLLLVVMILWGLNVVALKIVVDYMPPATMQALRIFSAGLVVLGFMIVCKDFKQMKKARPALGSIVMACLLGVVGHHFFLAVGLQTTTATNTSLILALVPLTTAVFAMIFLGDPLTKTRLLGILSGFGGVFLILNAGDGSLGTLSSGDGFVLLSMAVQALSFIFIRRATVYIHPRPLTGLMFMGGSAILLVMSFLLEPGGFAVMFSAPVSVWLVFAGSAILATAVGHQLYNGAIQRIGAGEAAIFNNFVPFFGVVSSVIFLNETAYPAQWIGFLFIVLGVLLGTGYIEQKVLTGRRYNTST